MHLHSDTSRPAVALEAPCSTGSELSLFFPHSGRGQSILIRVPPNSWIVIDVNKGRGEENPTRDFLRLYKEQPDFEVLALVITHFHEDHYSGITEILDLCCEEAAGQRDPTLLQRLILPCPYGAFRDFLKAQNYDGIKGHLQKLLRYVEELGERMIGTLPAMQFAWPGSNLAELQAPESWCFTFYPATDDLIRDFLAKLESQPDLRARAALTRQLQEDANRYAYLLEVGCGRNCGDLCFLLTSDLPGSVLGSFTSLLRDRIIPDVLARHFGAFWGIEPLIDRDAPPFHLRPIHGLTVPHHGSGQDVMGHEDLSWWLGSWKTRAQPAFAIAQGGPHALRENTVKELATAHLRILATSRPERLLDGNEACRDLGSRMRGRLRPAPETPYSVVQMEVDMKDDAHPDIPCLTIHGGSGGLHRVVARRLYEICVDPPRIIFHELTQLFPS